MASLSAPSAAGGVGDGLGDGQVGRDELVNRACASCPQKSGNAGRHNNQTYPFVFQRDCACDAGYATAAHGPTLTTSVGCYHCAAGYHRSSVTTQGNSDVVCSPIDYCTQTTLSQ